MRLHDTKQILVMRRDLNVKNFGKLIAQGGHAAIGSFLPRETTQLLPQEDGSVLLIAKISAEQAAWFTELSIKVAVAADNEAHLLAIYEQAKEAGLPCVLIQDAGFTEFDGPTYTAVGIGPAPKDAVDPITRGLPLFR
jgi:PTH2 family peptidyl-tRNA hydrolase